MKFLFGISLILSFHLCGFSQAEEMQVNVWDGLGGQEQFETKDYGHVGLFGNEQNQEDISETVTTYPNPARSKIFVVSAEYAMAEIAIFDILGHRVFVMQFDNPGPEVGLDISNIKEGMYILQLTTIEGYKVSKTFRKLN